MSLEKQQQKNTKQNKSTHTAKLKLYVDYEDVYGPYIFVTELFSFY